MFPIKFKYDKTLLIEDCNEITSISGIKNIEHLQQCPNLTKISNKLTKNKKFSRCQCILQIQQV